MIPTNLNKTNIVSTARKKNNFNFEENRCIDLFLKYYMVSSGSRILIILFKLYLWTEWQLIVSLVLINERISINHFIELNDYFYMFTEPAIKYLFSWTKNLGISNIGKVFFYCVNSLSTWQLTPLHLLVSPIFLRFRIYPIHWREKSNVHIQSMISYPLSLLFLHGRCIHSLNS
jgi:hypothetical protein